MTQPIQTRTILAGTQQLYRFPNGYGASVVQGPHTYGGSQGLSELAVIVWTGDGENSYDLTYDTPVTEDVEGYLNEDDVARLLAQIEALPAKESV